MFGIGFSATTALMPRITPARFQHRQSCADQP